MDYSTMMHSIPQMGMPYGAMSRPNDMSRPRQHAYPYSYGGEPLYLFPHMPAHHRNMTEAQMALATKQMDPKPRLGKDEVQLLENEFQKNPKPSSLRKREIAELLKVDNPRINNWFQNRRAKAKQMSRRVEPATQSDVSPSASSPSEQLDDTSMVSEYFGSQNQSLPLRASSATFPATEQPSLAVYLPHNGGSIAAAHGTSPSTHSTEEYPSPKSLVYPPPTSAAHELPFPPVMNGAYLATPHNTTSYSSHASPQHVSSMGAEQGLKPEFDQNMGAYVPFTTAMGAENVMAHVGSFQSELLSVDDVPQLDKDLHVMQSYEVPSFDETLSQSMSAAGSPQSASGHSPVSAISDLRFKSPPPPANIATRRNKGVPAMLNSTALRSQAFGPKTGIDMGSKRADGGPAPVIRRIASATGLMSNRIQKPSVPTAPRSPLYYERNKEALLQTLQTATASANGGPLVRSLSNNTSPVSPNESMAPNGAMVGSGSSDDEQYLPYHNGAAAAGSHSTYFSAKPSTLKTPPGTPGFNGLAQSSNEHQRVVETHWNFVPQDEALLTPSLGSFSSDEFPMLQTAPSYIMNSQPPTPSVHQPLGHSYFPLRLQGAGGGGAPGATGQSEYTFPGEGYMFPGSSGKASPGRSKAKQFQFTQNMTPQDYNAEK
ncbi:hypothetical protein SBRCBS47491_007069 [Sporothrix bragantina]|uniref:Homeobox domain-containing protein n=1 Tax=Sporothrix bragantina TaxID=671064 RepID=A0ABP0CA45_9PEZI